MTYSWCWKAARWGGRSTWKCCAAERRGASRLRSGNGPEGIDMRGFGEIAERLRRSTVQVIPDEGGRQRGQRSGGSGIVWSSDGLIVTNAHVARTAEADVELWDGRRLR